MDFKLHYYQAELVKKLAYGKGLRFNGLLIEGLGSEHMNYHLKKLLELGLVSKNQTAYFLTDTGKDYFNLLDEKTDMVEKQPKISVIVHAKRKNKKGKVEHLLMKRLRQPYYGKVGHLTGKVKFGETLAEAANRELYEETGLRAKNFLLERVHRKIRQNIEGIVVQDILFYTFLATNISGSLIERTPFQQNFWITHREFKTRKNMDAFDDFRLDNNLKPREIKLKEDIGIAEGF